MATDISGLAIITLAGFAATPIVVGAIGAEAYGYWLTTVQVGAVLGLLDFSLGLGLLRLTSDPELRRGPRFGPLVSSAFFTYMALSGTVVVLGVLGAPLTRDWFRLPEAGAEVTLTFQIAAGSIAIGLLSTTFLMLLAAMQRLVLTNAIATVSSLGATLLPLVFIATGMGLVSLPLGAVLSAAIAGVIAYVAARRICPPFRLDPREVDRADVRRLWGFSSAVQVVRVAGLATTSAPAIVIALAMGAAAVTPFMLTARLPMLLGVLVASRLPSQIAPAVSELYARGAGDRVGRAFRALSQITLRLGLVSACFVALADRTFVSLWVGDEHYAGDLVVSVLAAATVVETFSRGIGAIVWLSPSAVRGYGAAAAAEALLMISLALALLPNAGLTGMAIAMLASRVITAVYGPLRALQLTGVDLRGYLTDMLFTVMRSLPGLAVTWLVATVVPLERGWGWVIVLLGIATATNVAAFEVPRLIRADGSLSQRLRRALAPN